MTDDERCAKELCEQVIRHDEQISGMRGLLEILNRKLNLVFLAILCLSIGSHISLKDIAAFAGTLR